MAPLNSYPSIFNVGHAAVKDLFKDPVYVQEKIDGSQFSFGVDLNGVLYARSKGASLNLEAPEKMFSEAVATVKELQPLLHPGWTYRGEYLKKPNHNTLIYMRVPNKHVILFDINTGLEEYLGYSDVVVEATRLGLETVPLLHEGVIEDLNEFRKFLETVSVLGGNKVEGVVIKPVGYNVFGKDKKALMAKFVSEAFKEAHQGAWKEANPGQSDILIKLSIDYKTVARWQKAVQHLKETGELTDSPQDIGKLINEVGRDTDKECQEEIKHLLYKWAWPKLSRAIIAGLPEWYKEELLKKQFATETA